MYQAMIVRDHGAFGLRGTRVPPAPQDYPQTHHVAEHMVTDAPGGVAFHGHFWMTRGLLHQGSDSTNDSGND